MKTLHEKIKNYLITQNLLGIKIIAKEKICYMKRKENGKLEMYKLDLLGADENLYYFIEIKTEMVSERNVNKYIKIFNNYNFLYRGVKIIFVAKNISKNAEKAISESKCNIEIVWFDELDKIEKIKIKKIYRIPYTRDLDEYRVSLLSKMYFSNIRCFGKRFIGTTHNGVPAIEYTFLNNYTVILEFYDNNYVNIDLYYNYKSKVHFRYMLLYFYFVNEELQFRFIDDLICMIGKLTHKMTSEEYHDIAEKLVPLVNAKITKSKLPYQLLNLR